MVIRQKFYQALHRVLGGSPSLQATQTNLLMSLCNSSEKGLRAVPNNSRRTVASPLSSTTMSRNR